MCIQNHSSHAHNLVKMLLDHRGEDFLSALVIQQLTAKSSAFQKASHGLQLILSAPLIKRNLFQHLLSRGIHTRRPHQLLMTQQEPLLSHGAMQRLNVNRTEQDCVVRWK